MRATRRRQRKHDSMAAPDSIRAVFKYLYERLPFSIPKSEKEIIRFLYAVGNAERRSATDTKRGRPSKWTREQLTEAASILRGILDRETHGRVSVKSFISQYLNILRFPADILKALADKRINLQESIHLSRISSTRLGCTQREAIRLRREILEAHIIIHGSQTALRLRVKELLGETREPEITTKTLTEAVSIVDELLKIDPSDSRHLFWEQMKDIFFAMREVKPEDLDDELLEEFATAIDQTSAVLYKIKRKKAKGKQ